MRGFPAVELSRGALGGGQRRHELAVGRMERCTPYFTGY